MSYGRKPTEFELGALIAVSLIVGLHDEPGIAADVARELQLSGINISELAEYDIANLKAVHRTRGVKFKGVRGTRSAPAGKEEGDGQS